MAGGLDSPGFGIAWNEELGLLVAGSENGALSYWRKDVTLGVRTAEHSAQVINNAHDGPVTAVATVGELFASGGFDGKVILWSLPAEKVLHALTAGGPVRALAAAPDGKTLASAGDDGVVQLWDAATGKPGDTLIGASDWLLAVAFSPDGKTVAAGSIDGRCYLWDLASTELLLEFSAVTPPMPNQKAMPAAAAALAFSPDGKTLAIGSADGQVYLFQIDGKFLRALTGHTSGVTAVAFHPTGTMLASASKDRTLRLWTPANGQMVKALEGHTAWVQGLAFLAHGSRLASVGADHTVRLWDLSDPAKK